MSLIESIEPSSPVIDFTPARIARRQFAKWQGLQAEIVQVTENEPFEYDFCAPFHLLVACERSERYDGETSVEGLPTSNLRDLSGKLTFIPAGSRFHGWQKPRILARVTYFYFDPRGPLVDPGLHFDEIDFKPRLFFSDKDLWETTLKLKAQIEN